MDANGPKVLVVDDQESATHILDLLLSRLGFRVRTVNDSRKAVAVAREFMPSVVLLDIAMPYMSGYEIAKRMRDDPTFAQVKIIAVTAFQHKEHFKRVRALGIDDQMSKPCDFRALGSLIDRYCHAADGAADKSPQ